MAQTPPNARVEMMREVIAFYGAGISLIALACAGAGILDVFSPVLEFVVLIVVLAASLLTLLMLIEKRMLQVARHVAAEAAAGAREGAEP